MKKLLFLTTILTLLFSVNVLAEGQQDSTPAGADLCSDDPTVEETTSGTAVGAGDGSSGSVREEGREPGS